jgi:deoxycytidylate deaminase
VTCAKRHVVCHLYDRHGLIVATGSNRCANPQPVCPREPGEGYAKCTSICGQYGHAEEVALKNAAGHDLAGGLAYVTHERICDMCRDALEAAGITRVETL